jgi:iron complex outermembrane receptor protein
MLLAASDASAQTAPASKSTGAKSSTAADSATVGEVIVTANKRNEAIEDVPVAVTAFTPEQRDLLGVVSIFDITRATPSLEYSTAIDRAFIRGIGRNTNAPGTQAGVALYIDGVYTPSTYGLDRASILSGNLETDSGPQGTLFGRNSIGGVIQQTSAHAPDHFEIKTDLRYSDHGRFDGAVTIGGPVNDHIKLIYGLDYRDQTKGYFHNVFLNVDQGGPTTERLNYALADYTFGNFDGFAKVEFTGYNRKLSQFSQYGATYSNLPANFNDYTSDNFIGVTGNFNCPVDPVTNQRYAPGACPTNFKQATTYYDPTNVTATNSFLIKQDTRTSFKSHSDWDAVDQTTWHLPWFDAKYIGGYTQYTYDNHQDFDNTARGIFGYDPDGPAGSGGIGGINLPAVNINPTVYQYYENRKWSSHELDFSSNGKGPLTWILGLYYYQDDFLNTTAVNAPGQAQLNLIPGVSNPNLNYYSTSGDAKTKSDAIFGQVDYDITSKWRLTAGLRWNHDSLTTIEQDHYYEFVPNAFNYNATTGQYVGANYSFLLAGSCTAGITKAGAKCSYDAANNVRTISDSWSGWGGTVNLSYKPNDSSLAYAKYSRGYKAGGLVVSGGMSPSPVLNPEGLNAYELGYKFSPSRQITINSDIFYYDYRGYQDFGSIPNTTSTTPATLSVGFNVPKSRNIGLELTGSWHPIHAFTLTMSGNYMDAKVTDGGTVCLVDALDPTASGTTTINNQNAPSRTVTYKPNVKPFCGAPFLAGGVMNQPQSITGDVLKGSSPWKVWLSPDYRLDFAKGSLDLIGTYSIRAGNVSGYSKNPVYQAPSYSEVDLRAVWSSANSKYQVIGFVNNIFDKAGTEFVLAGTNAGDGSHYVENVLTIPRTYGIELQAKF